jgi:predicted site-specific integrase-resolvase
MPITSNGRMFYRMQEALLEADISRATFFRWVRDGRIPDARFRDRNGRRLLTREELDAIKQLSLEVVDTAVAKPPIKFRSRSD